MGHGWWVIRMSEPSWVVDMEKELEAAKPSAQPCIFRVPRTFRKLNDSVYTPKMVSLGPFHHKDPDLLRMREHKFRAVRHILDRAKKKLTELVETVKEVAGELEAAYVDLDDEWRSVANPGRFLKMMIEDGCFLMEMIRKHAKMIEDYKSDDPVFGVHGVRLRAPYIGRDMLLIENQLPLLLLERIDTFETGKCPNKAEISRLVLNFITAGQADVAPESALHPLDLYRKSRLGTRSRLPAPQGVGGGSAGNNSTRNGKQEPVPCSARKLYEMGVRFQPCESKLLDDVDFSQGKLTMPKLVVDDSSEYLLHNIMAFEALHADTTNDITAYMLFLKDVIDSADDVEFLVHKGILDKQISGSDGEVVRLFYNLTKDVVKYDDSTLCHRRKELEEYCRSNKLRVYFHRGWIHLRNRYFKIPWQFLALVAAAIYLVPDVLQTIYAILSYQYQKNHPN